MVQLICIAVKMRYINIRAFADKDEMHLMFYTVEINIVNGCEV